MKALEYLKHIGIIENENSKFLIKFEDGREFDVVEILEGYKNIIEYKGNFYKVGDRVLVKGIKSVGNYETEIIKNRFEGFSLKENKTYLNDDSSLIAIINKI